MAISDVYSVTLKQNLLGQQMENVFFYQQQNTVITVGETIAHALAEQWYRQKLDAITGIQNTDVTTQEVEVINLFDESDYGVSVLTGHGGTWSGDTDTHAAFVAVGYQLKGDNHSVKEGSKRFGGISDNVSTDGVITNTSYLALTGTLSAALASPVTNGAIIPIDTWYPVTVKRFRSGTRPDYKYRLPKTLAETAISVITGALLDLVLTSQVSRKLGRGV